MKYTFKCNCGNIEEIDRPMKDISSLKLICSKCNSPMKRVWSTSFSIPESMKNENSQDVAYVNNLMKNMPTGRRKAIY